MFSIITRNPLEAITPNSRNEIPPITGEGIDSIKALNLPIKLKKMANTAAPAIT